MSQENVEIVRKACDDFNAFIRGELTTEEAAELLDPQIQVSWHEERSLTDLPHHLQGPEELIAYLGRRGAVGLTLEPVEFIEAPDDRVLTPLIQWFGGREGSAPFEIHFSYVWTIRDGRVHKVEVYLRRDDALKAAGLSG